MPHEPSDTSEHLLTAEREWIVRLRAVAIVAVPFACADASQMGALTVCQRAPRWWAAIEIGLLERIAQFGRLVAEPADLARLRAWAPFIAWAGAADVVAARAIVEAIGVGLARFVS